jgi:hypothetical protein
VLRRALLVLFSWAIVVACRNGEKTGATSGAKLPAAPFSAWSPTRVAEIYFSTEVDGYIEPCGCTTKPLGGIQRLATVLARGAKDRALIDAGDLFFPTTGLDDTTRQQHVFKSRMLARAYRQLGAVAINVAESDLFGGIDLLKDLQREGAVPLLSANVRPIGDSGPVVARSVIRNVGGIRVGITGIATPERVAGIDGVTAIEYGPSVRAEVSAMRKGGADVVIVLAHAGEVGAREIAKAVPEIDVIVRAPGTPIEREPSGPEKVGSVVIVEAGSQGQHIGRLTIALGPKAPERPLALDDTGQAELRRRALAERKIKAYRMEIDAWSVDPTKAEAVQAKKAQIEGLEAKLKEPMPEPAPMTGPSMRVDLVKLTDDIPPDPEMSRLLAAYYVQLREMNMEKGDVSRCKQADKAQAVFIGTEKCIECHEEEYAFWKKTKHAKAWATLEEQGKHFDLTCIGCHTVGYQQPGGFCRLKDVGVLKNVGCESCHGPGSAHAKDKDASSIRLSVSDDFCRSSCHTPEHSDAFVFEKYVREITGAGHDLSEKK